MNMGKEEGKKFLLEEQKRKRRDSVKFFHRVLIPKKNSKYFVFLNDFFFVYFLNYVCLYNVHIIFLLGNAV